MESNLRQKILNYLQAHHYRSRWQKVVTVLACIVVFFTAYALILPAITMSKETICGMEEHQHGESCFTIEQSKPQTEMLCSKDSLAIHSHTADCQNEEGEFVCGYADFILHTHDALCYAEDGTLICTLEEIEKHEHDSSCFTAENVLICGREENESGHQHGEGCYTRIQGELSCGLQETEGHTHGEECYGYEETNAENSSIEAQEGTVSASDEKVLLCGLEEEAPHTHSDDCYQWTEELTCEIEETEGHVHSQECYETKETLTCGQMGLHTHEESCFDENGGLVCGQMEVLEHQHTEECLIRSEGASEEKKTLICELPEHQHGEGCFPTEEAPEKEETEYVCGQEEHTHDSEACFDENGELICVIPEHIHTEDCLLQEMMPAAERVGGKFENGFTWNLENSILTIEGNGRMEDWGSQSMQPWSQYREEIQQIVLTDGITGIGSYAFYKCSNLEAVDLPGGLTHIGSNAFYGCSNLGAVDLPDGLTDIGSYAFYECSNLKTDLPDSIRTIGIRAFLDCDGLTTIKLSQNLENLMSGAFENCSNVKEITIPGSLKNIPNSGFKSCSSLKRVVIEEGVISIGEMAFWGDGELKQMKLPSTLESIEEEAFYALSKLSSIEIPANVTEIGANCFKWCNDLNTFVWNAKSAEMQGCEALNEAFQLIIGQDVVEISETTMSNLLAMGAGDVRFQGPNQLSLPSYALPQCFVNITGGDYYVDGQGVLYRLENNEATLMYCPPEISTYTIADKLSLENNNTALVTGIGSHAFAQCENLTSLNFVNPNGIREIGSYAFANAGKLGSINGKTSVEDVQNLFADANIGIQAFYNTALTGRLEAAQSDVRADIRDKDGNVQAEITISTKPNREPGQGQSGLLYYTGEVSKTSISIEQQAGAPVGTSLRVYIQFDDFGGRLSREIGDYTVEGGSGAEWKLQVYKTEAPEIYCYEFITPGVGSTLSYEIPIGYPSPNSGGGGATIWAAALSAEEAAELGKNITKPEAYQYLYWETKRDTFPVSNEDASGTELGIILQDDAAVLEGLSYQVQMARVGETLEGVGKDLMVSADCVDVLTLPEGVELDKEIAEAIKAGEYSSKVMADHYQVEVNGKTILMLYVGRYDQMFAHEPEVFINENNQLEIHWQWVNKGLKHESTDTEIGEQTVRISYLPPLIHISDPQPNTNYQFTNQLNVTQHFCYSDDVSVPAEAAATVHLGEGAVEIEKAGEPESTSMGSKYPFTITLRNPSPLPYDLTGSVVEDTLPDSLYLETEDIEEMFQSAKGSEKYELTMEIEFTKYLDKPFVSEKVTGMDGVTEVQTNLATSGIDTRYKGLSEKEQHEKEGKILITLTQSEDGIHAKIKKNEEEERVALIGEKQTYKTLEALFNELGVWFTKFHNSVKIQWKFKDGQILKPAESLILHLPAKVVDSFRFVDVDELYNVDHDVERFQNTATFKKGDYSLNASVKHPGFTEDFDIRKTCTIDGKTLSEENKPQHGSVLEHRVYVDHKGSGAYDILPLVDHMSGMNALLVPVEHNRDAAWAKGLTVVSYKEKSYYVLDKPGEYEHVWVGEVGDYINGKIAMADSITVTATGDNSRDTLIKWYFTDYKNTRYEQNYPRTDVMYYLSTITAEGELRFSYGNEVWLGDHESQRLYDVIGGSASAFGFDKYIVKGKDDETVGAKHTVIGAGETVYYRLDFHSNTRITLKGGQIYDVLPKGLGQWSWEKGKNIRISYANCQVSDENAWHIENFDDRQELRWNSDFTFTFSGTAYIYVELDFPDGDTWDAYCEAYNKAGQQLENTLYVLGEFDQVTHDLRQESKVRLQKGVYEVGKRQMEDGSGRNDPILQEEYDARKYYANDDAWYHYVNYYLAIYNEGPNRLYLTEVQDILPRGFTMAGILEGRAEYPDKFDDSQDSWKIKTGYDLYRTPYLSIWKQDKFEAKNMEAIVTADKTLMEDGREKITFSFKNSPTSADKYELSYDKERQMCYLNPGESLQFGYVVNTNSIEDTETLALNTAAMPYYDYVGGGVTVAEPKANVYNPGETKDMKPNDGDCELSDNATASAQGFTGGEENTRWLVSEVEQIRGHITPGVTKALTKAQSEGGIEVTNPVTAGSLDTLTWKVTYQNGGASSITDYVLSDTMQAPYQFTGDVTCEIRGGGLNPGVLIPDKGLFSIVSREGDKRILEHYDSEQRKTVQTELTVNGDPVTLSGITWKWKYSSANAKYENQSVEIAIQRDEQTNAETLFIRMENPILSVPEGGKLELTVQTKRFDDTEVNAVFVNQAFITPLVQDWQGAPQQGNNAQLQTPFGKQNKSVRNSALVTTTYGYATSSVKEVRETDNPNENWTDSNAQGSGKRNFILLDNNEKNFTYSLKVKNSDTALDELILIDNLPETGDHNPFLDNLPRNSEFKVRLADDLKPVVTVATDGSTKTLEKGADYTVQYSTKTSFTDEDWKGNAEGWNETYDANTRSIRLIIRDSEGTKALIPPESELAFSFDAQIDIGAGVPEPLPGQTAWNSFGYRYSAVDNDTYLEASPLEVGVRIPSVPELFKELRTGGGQPVLAEEEQTFRFLIYEGSPVPEQEDMLDVLAKRKVTTAEVVVKKGESQSEILRLDELFICTYDETSGKWQPTGQPWSWEEGKEYNLLELPTENSDYVFDSINQEKNRTYTFTYEPAYTLRLEAVNQLNDWMLLLHKTNTEGDVSLPGAWFALYSIDERDAVNVGELELPEDVEPQDEIVNESITYYLTRVSETGSGGYLSWDGLIRDKYLYQELKAPEGFTLDAVPRVVKRTEEKNVTVTVTNEGGVVIPETGGAGTFPYMLAGLALMLTGLLYGYSKYRKGGKIL